MPDYKSMYYTLFNQVTKTIEDLQKIQQMTEEMFIESEDAELVIYKESEGENLNFQFGYPGTMLFFRYITG